MSDEFSGESFEAVLDRRSFTALAGGTVAALCSGVATADSEGATSESEETTVYDVTVESVADHPMDYLDWNAEFAGWPTIWGRWLTYERYAQYDLERNEWIPRLISEWSIEETTITLSIRDPHTFADGDPVTAADVKANIVMHLATGIPFADVFESFTELDEKTLEIETSESINESILEFVILAQHQQAKMAPPYDEFYERFWEDGEDIEGDLRGREPDEPDYVSGIFTQQTRDEKQYLLQRNPEHPDAGNVNFERYRFPTHAGNEAKREAMLDEEVDTVASLYTPSNILTELDDHWQEYTFPGNWGVGLMPNHDPDVAPHISKRPVRRAITHAIDRNEVAEAAGQRVKTPFPTPAAISATVQEQYIDVGGQFTAMQDGEEAVVEIMQDAGYERNSDDVWAMDGEAVSVELAVPSNWSDWVVCAESIVDQLSTNGFEASLNRVNDIFSTVQDGEFTLATRPWSPGKARSSFPYFPLNWVFGRVDGNAHNYPGWDEDNTIEVPEMDGSGTMEVNLRERLDDLSVARGDDVEPIVQELAWVSHQDLPMIPIIDKREQSFISTRNLTAPEKDDPEGNVKWPCFDGIQTGAVAYDGPEPIAGTIPRDVDGDGRYEDTNGDGRVNFPDVNRFFQQTDSSAVTESARFYDFNDDGEVTLQDVMALFDMV